MLSSGIADAASMANILKAFNKASHWQEAFWCLFEVPTAFKLDAWHTHAKHGRCKKERHPKDTVGARELVSSQVVKRSFLKGCSGAEVCSSVCPMTSNLVGQSMIAIFCKPSSIPAKGVRPRSLGRRNYCSKAVRTMRSRTLLGITMSPWRNLVASRANGNKPWTSCSIHPVPARSPSPTGSVLQSVCVRTP